MNDEDTDNKPMVLDRAMLTDEIFWEMIMAGAGARVPYLLR